MSSRRRATTSRSSSPARRSSPAKPRAAPNLRPGTTQESGHSEFLQLCIYNFKTRRLRNLACERCTQLGVIETHYTYTPSDARVARALCCDDVRAERAPLVCGVHEGLGGMLGVHVAHFRPMCLTARNSLRHPTSPITSRTGPTRFDARKART